jgi:hypothetical protein
MSDVTTRAEALPIGADDPPIDFSREEAAYEKEKGRLVREFLGRIALVHGDQVVGVFPSADEAILEAFRRFGTDKVMLKEVRDPDEPDFISLADTQHPSFQKLEPANAERSFPW